MKRILLLLTAVILCGTLTMNGQARKTTNRPSAKARTTSAAKATPKAKAATPATPASDLPLFCLKGKVKKLTEKKFIWGYTDPVYDSNGYIDEQKSKMGLESWGSTIYSFTEDGFLSGYETIAPDGSRTPHEFTTDAKGRLTKATYDEMLEGEELIKAAMVIKRNAAGKASSFIIRANNDPSYELWSRCLTLRPNGKISKIANSSEYDNWNEIYSYDANGMLTKITYKNEIGTFVNNMKYDPARDAQGNWLKCEKSGRDDEVIEREIEYYE